MSLDLALTKDFTEMQLAFIHEVSLGFQPEEAALRAGYSSESAKRVTYEMLRQPQIVAAIQINVARDLAVGSAVAKRVLQEFVADDKLDKRLRFACAKTLLDRAGHIAPKAVAAAQGGETPLNEMSMTDLRALADKLSGEIAGRAKVVNSAKAAPVKTQAFDDLI